jgi:alpha-mannosidase
MFGVPWNGDTIQPPDMNRFFSLASADLVVPNMEAWGLLWDFQTLRELVDSLPGNTPFVLFIFFVTDDINFIVRTGSRTRHFRLRMKL